MFNGLIVLEIYKDPIHPKRLTIPAAYGLHHLCFQIEDIGDDYKVDKKDKFKFIYDPDEKYERLNIIGLLKEANRYGRNKI